MLSLTFYSTDSKMFFLAINLLVWSHVIHFYCFQPSNSILGCFLAQGWILGCLGTLICNKASEPIFPISLVLFAPRGSSLVCFWLLQPKTGQKLSKKCKKGPKMGMNKWPISEKTYPPIGLKLGQNTILGPIIMIIKVWS